MFDEELEPWADSARSAWSPEEDPEAWRGNVHFEGWPEDLAGPEYWLFKRSDDE